MSLQQNEIRIKFLLERKIGGSWGDEPNDDSSIVCIRAADFDTDLMSHSKINLTRRSFSEAEIESKALQFGDLIIEKSGGGENQPVGRVVKFELDEVALCSNFLEVLRPNSRLVNPDYIVYLLYSFWKQRIVTRSIKQTTGIQNLDVSDYLDNKVLLPNIDLQNRIVSYLRKELSSIDILIAKKEEQLKLLSEKRQALITQVVTKGLDPGVKLKESGIEWLGEIPKHWEVKKLKYLTSVNPTSKTYDFNSESDEEVVFLAMESVSELGEIDTSTKKPISEIAAGYTYFESDDVVVAKITPCFENGKGAWLKDLETKIGFGTTEFHVLRATKKILPEFLYFVTISLPFRAFGTATMKGAAGQKRVTPEFVKEYKVAIPSVEEQGDILQQLKNELYSIEEMNRLTEYSIKLLQERRSALITSAVTCKLDF